MSRVFAGRVPWGAGQIAGEAEREQSAPIVRWAFECPVGHEFEVPFAHDAELPDTWDCRQHGRKSELLAARPQPKKVKPPRTHWDMLLERRSIADLEVLLEERLHKLRSDRRFV